VFDVVRGRQKLEPGTSVDKKLAKRLVQLLPEQGRKDTGGRDMAIDRRWTWRPIGNEELAWASSGHYTPVVHGDADARDLWMFGGDDLGSFRRLVGYVWGRVNVGPKERKIPKPPKSKEKPKTKPARR
jgi:hypothetical protein